MVRFFNPENMADKDRETQAEATQLLVASFDFDGCIYQRSFLRRINSPYERGEKVGAYLPPHNKDELLIEHNKELLGDIKKLQQTLTAERLITFIGSARQDHDIDSTGVEWYGLSCFKDIDVLTKHLDAEHDALLLADIFGNLPLGTSFTRATDSSYAGEHASCLDDRSKLSILYAQMHHVATKNPEATITFCFYDDNISILRGLYRFFATNPEAIPSNLTLNLHRYAFGKLTQVEPIEGTGIIDKDYAGTLRELINIAKPGMLIDDESVHMTRITTMATILEARGWNSVSYQSSCFPL